MSIFNLDPTASENLSALAEQNGLNVENEELQPAWYSPENIKTQALRYGVSYLQAGVEETEALTQGVKRGFYRAQYAAIPSDEELKQQTLKKIEAAKIPETANLGAQIIYGLADPLTMLAVDTITNPERILAPPLASTEASMTYAKSQTELHVAEGMDRKTAENVAGTEAVSLGIGFMLPASLPGNLITRVLTGAGIQAGAGALERGAVSSTLRDAGYNEMADQYKALDTKSMAIDLALGGLFGAIHIPEVRPSDLDPILTANNSKHADVDVAPGIPADLETVQAHSDMIKNAVDSLMNDREVVATEQVSNGNFVQDPNAQQFNTELASVTDEHLGSLETLKKELEARGLPTDEALYSRGVVMGDGVEKVTQAAREAFGDDTARLVDSGAVQVVERASDLPARPDGQPHPADAKGYFDGERVYLVGENLTSGETKGVILHEVGAHVGMEKMLGAKLYGKLTQEVADRAAAGEADFAEALRQVPVDTPAGKVNDEALAYLVQNRPNLPLVKRIISTVKAALYRLLGGRLVKLNADDIRTLAVAALKRTSSAETAKRRGDTGFYNRDVGAIERPTIAIKEGVTHIDVDGVTRPALNSKGQLIHWSEEGVRNFWRWFGDSKVVDDQGRPLVVYHGTATDFSTFKYDVNFFTPDESWAMFHAQMRQEDILFSEPDPEIQPSALAMPVYLAFERPLVVDGRTLPDDAYLNNYDNETERARNENYDSLIILNTEGNTEYITLSQKSIKSATDNVGTFDTTRTNIMYSRITKHGVESPGAGVAQENLNGFEPDLRVKVPMGKVTLPEKPLVLTGTNMKNASRQIKGIDEALAKFPNADKSPLEWSKMMAYAMATDDVPIPPYRFLKEINSDGAVNKLEKLTAGQIADADHGFENARLFREAYTSGNLRIETTGKLFLWSFLSRGVSPYTQEGLFIDAFPSVDKWINKAAAGELTEADFPEYEKWAKSIAPQGSGQPGSGATHNLNAFGRLFLFKMGQKGADGKSKLQHMHEMMSDPNMTGKDIRRWFISNTEGVGIDNKVVSFTLLVAGFPDVMVLDRVQIRQLWDDGRFANRNLYDGRKVDGKPVAGSALSEITYGARGLLIYEAVERALAKRIENIYTALGRPNDASIGRYHWESWVADSQQEASHGTLDAILHDARGNSEMISEVTAKEGEYGAYQYGARYGRTAVGEPYFLYQVGKGQEFQFTIEGFRNFIDAVKSPKNGVVPSKFKVTEAGNAPWYERSEVNKSKLEELANEYAIRPDLIGDRTVQAPEPSKAVSNLARRKDPYSSENIIANSPDLTIVSDDGVEVPAGRALTQIDTEITKAKQDSQGFDAAVACALRG